MDGLDDAVFCSSRIVEIFEISSQDDDKAVLYSLGPMLSCLVCDAYCLQDPPKMAFVFDQHRPGSLFVHVSSVSDSYREA